jgi:hypothetical protein
MSFMIVKRLTQKHDDEYLTKLTIDCLNQFSLAKLVYMSFYLFYNPENLLVTLCMYR